MLKKTKICLSIVAAMLFIAHPAHTSEAGNSSFDTVKLEELSKNQDALGYSDLVAHAHHKNKKKKERKKKCPKTQVINSWKPYCLKNRYLESAYGYYFNADVGLGLLYFSNITSNLQYTSLIATNEVVATANPTDQLSGKLGYNRTPNFETSLGIKLFHFLSFGLSYMHQGNVQIQTKAQYYGRPPVVNNLLAGQPAYIFLSNVNLDAVLFNIYVNMPCSLIWKTIAFNPYLGGGIGPGWQAWSHNRDGVISPYSSANLFASTVLTYLKQKVSCNAVWKADVGVKLRSVLPNINLSVRMGTKLVGWGQARQIGLISQQANNIGFGLIRPFKVKFVYSIVPYIGVQWNY